MSTMTDSDHYNGYANRETWAFNLHWQNDQGFYGETLHIARRILAADTESGSVKIGDRTLGMAVVSHWREFLDSLDSPPASLLMFDREVGSWWRIDYKEVGEAVRESLDAEA